MRGAKIKSLHFRLVIIDLRHFIHATRRCFHDSSSYQILLS